MAFTLINGADPDEMPHVAAFHLALHCCQSTPVGVSSVQKVIKVFYCRYSASNMLA